MRPPWPLLMLGGLASCTHGAGGAVGRGWRSGDADLEPLRQPGTLAVRCDPPDAVVRVDGVVVGVASDFDGRERLLKLSGGRHRIGLSHPGYQSFATDLVGGDWRQTVQVQLAPVLN